MPMYEAVCKKCNTHIIYRQPVDKRDDTPKCCGQPAERQLAAPMGYVDRPAAG